MMSDVKWCVIAISLALSGGSTFAQEQPNEELRKQIEAQKQQLDALQKQVDALPKRGAEQEKKSQEGDVPELKFGGITFAPGLRLQVRYSFDDATDNNDVMLRRTRLKAKGKVFDIANYYSEIKVDNVGQYEKDPKAQVEASYLDFPIADALNLRVGLYDVPFSRNLLTSDSKVLFMDRALIVDELAKLGLVDNTLGLLAHGRPFKGRFEYAMGVFDNDVFEKVGGSGTKWSDQLMVAGRVAVDLFDPPKAGGYADYEASYIGEGNRLSFGTNVARLGKVHSGSSDFDLFGWGIDLFGNHGPFTLEAELDLFQKTMETAGASDMTGRGWYVQGGYVLPFRIPLGNRDLKLEPCLRYQQIEPSDEISDDKSQWSSVGLNAYLMGHKLKMQLDFTHKDEEGEEKKNDTFMVQMQWDF